MWGLILLTFPGAPLPAGLFADVWGLRAVDAAEAPVDLSALDAATKGGVHAAPLDAAAWLRRAAYARARGGGRFTFETAYALRRSWRLAPLDPDIAVSRLELAFELWPDLAAADRAAASREIEAMWRSTRLRADLQRMPDRIPSPAGRLACGLLLAELQEAS